jgi:hypothetical protein
MRHSKRSSAAAVIGALAAVSLSVAILFDFNGSSEREKGAVAPVTKDPWIRGGMLPLLPGGIEIRADQLETMASFEVASPAAAGTSTDQLVEAWYREQGIEELYLRYASGIDVSYAWKPWGNEDPLTHYQVLEKSGLPGYVTEVSGWPAFAIPPVPEEGRVGSIGFMIDGVQIEVVATSVSVSLDDLQEVAGSVALGYPARDRQT